MAAGDFGHKYSPAFAQLFIPSAWLPHQLGASVWGLMQVAMVAALYLPVCDSVWKGNVSAAQSFQVALMLAGGTLAGGSLVGGVLFETMQVLATWRLVPLLALPRLDPAQRRSAHADADADLDTVADALVRPPSPRPEPATIGGHASSTAP